MILQEIKRRDPRIKNTTNESLMAVLPDLMHARDVAFIHTQYAMIRDHLLNGVCVCFCSSTCFLTFVLPILSHKLVPTERCLIRGNTHE
eukprot:scaffold3201_cov115-Alexandrium_tamarense.AAC.2